MNTTSSSEQQPARAKLFQIMREIEIGMLTTVRPDGRLHTRPMVTLFDESDGPLWFFTAEHAPKIDEVEADRDVSVSYADTKRRVFAAISGQARVVRDRERMARLWSPTFVAWFPKGVDDPELGLLRVEVRSGEFWEAPSSTMVEILAAVQAGMENPPRADIGDHAKVRL